MLMNPVGWFEIPVTDTERATKFYEALLNLKLERRDIPDYEMVWFPSSASLPGASGALLNGMGYVPTKGGTVLYFSCLDDDIDAVIERGTAAGGKLYLPKKDIGEYGYIAWLEDTEGNTIGLHMPK